MCVCVCVTVLAFVCVCVRDCSLQLAECAGRLTWMKLIAALLPSLPLPVSNYMLADRCLHFSANCCGFSSNKHTLSREHAQIEMEGYAVKYVAGDVCVPEGGFKGWMLVYGLSVWAVWHTQTCTHVSIFTFGHWHNAFLYPWVNPNRLNKARIPT